ncbi:hypothetical protein J6590_037158 [Homalodisca vitripennis]|nr:hypothetical protein J6590_037158 [Homalodisca vitripennis]
MIDKHSLDPNYSTRYLVKYWTTDPERSDKRYAISPSRRCNALQTLKPNRMEMQCNQPRHKQSELPPPQTYNQLTVDSTDDVDS